MGILSWIIFGLIAGALAKFIMPGDNEPKGCIMTMLLGIIGAVVGGFIGSNVMGFEYSNWSLSGFFWAVGGAILVLLVYGAIAKKR